MCVFFSNVKGLYRLCKALLGRGDVAGAAKTCKKLAALTLSPDEAHDLARLQVRRKKNANLVFQDVSQAEVQEKAGQDVQIEESASDDNSE